MGTRKNSNDIEDKSGLSRDPVYLKVQRKMQEKNEQLKDHIGKVESQTQDINTTTAALKNRTEELAAKQDEILKQIMLISQSQTSPLAALQDGPQTTFRSPNGPNQTFNEADQIVPDRRNTWKVAKQQTDDGKGYDNGNRRLEEKRDSNFDVRSQMIPTQMRLNSRE